MSQFRQNPITKQWVLIAPNRAKRPEDFGTHRAMEGLPEHDPACPFCPGKESLNKELARMPQAGDWEVRVIENKFQALEQDVTMYRRHEFYNFRSGYGDHEVVITPKHNEPVAMQSLETIQLTLQAFIDRIHVIKQDEAISYAQIFHNHGRDAGASIIHPHHQIIATPMVPPHIHDEVLGAYHYFNHNNHCVYCDILKEEIALGERIVLETEHFVVLSAYASRKPFETWIVPKKHRARFEDLSPEEIVHLAAVLKKLLGQLYTKLADPALNFYIHTMPFIRQEHTLREQRSYHWHLTIFPRLTIWAGFEYATGIPINPMSPEQTAAFLKV
jgi:UDPglucose--hexose-1-phosphate uridylyltransferase